MPKDWIPSPLPTGRVAAFARLVTRWRLTEAEAAFLLQIDGSTWHMVRDGGTPDVDPEAHIRLGHCLDIEQAISVLAPDEDQGDWIRTPHPILFGHTPHHFLTTLDDALRSIRWTMLSETRLGFLGYPGYPGYPANDPGRRPAAVDRAMALIRWAVEQTIGRR